MNNRLLLAATLAALMASPTATMAQTWTAANLGASTESLGVTDTDMPSRDVLWGINYDGSAGGGVVQDMFVTTDNGASWLTNTITTANSADKTLTNVSAIDGTTAYIGGFDADNGGGLLFRTIDGGNSFTEMAIPTMTYLNIVHFFDANTGLLMGDPTGTGTFWEIFRTTDAGATWTRVPQASIPAANAGDYGLTNQYSAFGDNVWFTTNKGSIYHSTDRGVTWMKHATGFTGNSTTSAIREVEFSDANNGLLVSSTGAMRRTTDGGMTFTLVASPSGTVFNDNLSRVPGLANTYVGVSANTTNGVGSSVTYDAGQTWYTLDSMMAQYTDVIFFDSDRGWAGGFTQAAGVGGAFQYTGATLRNPLGVSADFVRDASAAYPNPTTGLLHLAGADARETVTVYDLNGRVLRRQTIGTTASIDLSDLRAGLYQVVITGSWTARTTRVAVTN
jgi:photosystem II stability/assembly factor-like uncharacterized protein